MISIPAQGCYDQLQYQDLPDCGYTQGANIKLDSILPSSCVVVKTHACGVNYADIIIRWGLYTSAKKFVGWPITPGFEFSGTVIEVGSDVKNVAVGDNVAGVSLFGSYSKCIQVPHEQLRKLPDNVSLSEAAGFLCTGLTAWYALFELCKLRKNDPVLIHSASGGVGSMLVQMAKKVLGCYVVGVVGRSHKVEFAKENGCDAVIDKSTQDLWTTAKELMTKGYKAVFDANGTETLQESYNHLMPGGRLVAFGGATLFPKSTKESTGVLRITDWLRLGWKAKSSPTFNPLDMTSDNKSIMCFNLSYMFKESVLVEESLTDLFKWIADGTIKVGKVTEYKLRNAGDAHRDMESGNTVGKLVLLTQEEKEAEEGGEEEVTENDNK